MRSETSHLMANEAKWDKWSESLDGKGWRNEFLRKAQAAVVTLLVLKENVRLLDIGCGTGWALGKASERFNSEGSFYGVDLSEKMIEKAKETFSGRNNFHFVTANAESVPLDSNFCDYIICTNSFHHYLHPVLALKEMHRLLVPSGRVYILDPTADSRLIRVLDRVMRFFESAHVRLYSSAEFQSMYHEAGLNYVRRVEISPHQIVHVGEKRS